MTELLPMATEDFATQALPVLFITLDCWVQRKKPEILDDLNTYCKDQYSHMKR